MKSTIFAILFAIVLIGVTILLTRGGPATQPDAPSAPVVVMENGIQVITITAKGGYSPSTVTASSSVSTVIRMKTNGTFDCSSALAIPAANYRGNLPATGTTDIPLAAQPKGGVVEGVCSMGMYHFSVRFE